MLRITFLKKTGSTTTGLGTIFKVFSNVGGGSLADLLAIKQDTLTYQEAASAAASGAATSETNATTSATAALASKNAATTSETNALTSKNAAATSATSAATSAGSATTSASSAATSETNALTSKNAAASSASSATTSATTATTQAAAAATSATASLASKNAAATSETNAAASATAALASKNAAATRDTNALTSKNAAATSATSATTSASSATTSASSATTSASSATTSASSATTQATASLASKNAAATSETNAAASATAALASKNAATTSETNATTSATAALASKNAAATSETNAATSATAALASKNAATTSETNALASKNAAAASATSATTSASTATTSASTATTQATAASGSATSASTSAATAVTNATTATTKASEASTSATGAAASKVLAEAAATSLEVTKAGRNQAQFEAMRAQNNEEYAASGFVHFGKEYSSGTNYKTINNGLWTDTTVPNLLYMGKSTTPSLGVSKTNEAVVNIAGITYSLESISVNAGVQSKIKFPQAPDGTVTYDSATGVVTDFKTAVDPKYGNVAGTVNEAVARAFEGEVKNGDFRLGNDGSWVASNGASPVVNSSNILVITQSASGNGQVDVANLDASLVNGVEYEATVVITSNTYNNLSFYLNGNIYTYKLGLNKFRFTFVTGANLLIFRNESAQIGMRADIASVAIRKVTNEVVTDRVDMWGFESYPEEVSVTNPYVYPNGLIQSLATTMDDIATSASARPVTYYAVFDGDTGSKGLGVNFFTATDANKKKVLANHKNKLYYLDDGRLVQWRLRQRTIAGAGNGDWTNISSADLTVSTLMFDNYLNRVAPQGASNVKAAFNNGVDNYLYPSSSIAVNPSNAVGVFCNRNSTMSNGVNGECYFLVCGTVNRLNQGAYHLSFNLSGASRYRNSSGVSGALAWNETLSKKPSSKKDCFDFGDTLTTGNQSPFVGLNWGNIVGGAGLNGRPDGRFYDAIYADGQGGVCRGMRYSANGLTPTDFSEADQKVKNGSYRGFEKQVFTRFHANTYSLYFNASNVNHSSLTVSAGGATVDLHSNGMPPNTPVVIYALSLNRVVYGRVSTSNGHVILSSSPDSRYSGAHVQNIFPVSTPIILAEYRDLSSSVGGSFLQTDVVGDPANILLTAALKDGWEGSWIPELPTGVTQELSFTRKLIASLSTPVIWTNDRGATWSISSMTYSSVTNKRSTIIAVQGVQIIQYQAFAKQTESAVNAVVYGGLVGVGRVFENAYYEIRLGALLSESLVGKVLTSTLGRGAGTLQLIQQGAIDIGGKILSGASDVPIHTTLDLVAPANNSAGFKALNYNVNLNQQGFIQYAYTELKHNGTNWGDDSKISIVDNQSTKVDLNGTTVLVGTAKLKEPLGWIKNKI
jgi:hypothetical protein